jgi:ribosomal protein S18
MIAAEKIDVGIRMERDLKDWLAERARIEHRTFTGIVAHCCAVYRERISAEGVAG